MSNLSQLKIAHYDWMGRKLNIMVYSNHVVILYISQDKIL